MVICPATNNFRSIGMIIQMLSRQEKEKVCAADGGGMGEKILAIACNCHSFSSGFLDKENGIRLRFERSMNISIIFGLLKIDQTRF